MTIYLNDRIINNKIDYTYNYILLITYLIIGIIPFLIVINIHLFINKRFLYIKIILF